jgi:hypothetical protein
MTTRLDSAYCAKARLQDTLKIELSAKQLREIDDILLDLVDENFDRGYEAGQEEGRE